MKGAISDKPRKCEKCGGMILKGERVYFIGYMLVCEHCIEWDKAA